MYRVLCLMGLLAMLTTPAMMAGGCGDDGNAGDPDGATGQDAGPGDDGGPGNDGATPDGGPDPLCTDGDGWCLEHNVRRYCAAGQWLEETCAAGSGCLQGACVTAACTDECRLGETSGGQTCELYDMGTGQWTTPDPAGSMHDRSRAYTQWLHRDGMYAGGVGNARYGDPPTYSTVTFLGGLGDSAIWTGTYLAAEAMRLKATGAADARANVIDLVQTLHLWFNVSGQPGLLARYAVPAGGGHPFPLGDVDCNESRVFCNVTYNGQSYDYLGHISRDQYQGVMLGYALAYEALSDEDEATRALIREDVVEFLQELMTERTETIHLTYNGTPLPQFDVTMRFTVLAPDEMDNGAIQLTIDTNNTEQSEMYGFQEFIPNLQDLLSQTPGIGGMVPSIPRADSGVMLASFFQVALLVTDGVVGYEAEHAVLLDYYENHTGPGGNVDDWLAIAALWLYNDDCGGGYYANNIVAEPMYNLARLETDPTRLAVIRDDILHGQLWAEHQGTKNSFFYFMYAANYPGADTNVGPEGAAQLAGFPPPPRARVAVNLLSDPLYQPHEAGCANQVDHSQAVDVADRVVSDFIWQRNPWELLDAGDLGLTYPGVDYLAAYWFGRFHGYLTDDTPSRCLVWRTP